MYERILKIFLVLIVLSFILIIYLFVENYSLNKEIETMKKDISSNKISIENKLHDVETAGVPKVEVTPMTVISSGGS